MRLHWHVTAASSKVLAALNYVPIESADHLQEMFVKANARRKVGGTGMNARSSRSHAVVQLLMTEHDLKALHKKIKAGQKS